MAWHLPKCFWKRCLHIYYHTPGTALESGKRSAGLGPVVWEYTAVWEGYPDTSVPCVQLLCEIHASLLCRNLTVGSQIEYLSCFLKLRNCQSEGARKRHFIENKLKAEAQGWDNIMQGTSSNPISENLNTWPIYTYGCPSFPLQLL